VPGPVGDDGIVAASWTAPSLASVSDRLSVEATWAALDCSAGFAWLARLAAGTPIITARMTAVIDEPLVVGRQYTVIGWPIAQEGRKLHAGTAIFDTSGKIMARSRQLWLIQRV
jgi:predicted amidohydrolase